VIGRMGGADRVPETVAELDDYVESMRPHMAMNDQTVEFIGFLAGRVGDQNLSRRDLLDRWIGIRASMGLMPEWARRMTGTYQPDFAYKVLFSSNNWLKATLVRWAYPELPCKRLALERASARRSLDTSAAA
jgi:uncharacterized protein (DUF2236 family)